MKKKKVIESPSTKRYLTSALISFISAFLFTVASLIYVADLNAELVNSAFWISIAFAGVRAGVKAIAGYIISLQ